jgi:cellulose synthase operon protein C
MFLLKNSSSGRTISPTKLALALALSCAPLAQACGPAFPLELLQDRPQTLQGMVSGDFAFEMQRLVAVDAAKYPQDTSEGYWWEYSPEQPVPEPRQKLETEGYSEAQVDSWRAARTAPSAELAYQVSADLPESHRNYLAGAIAFQQGLDADAKGYFEAASADDARAVWSSFMLGRIARRNNDSAAMSAHLAKTRELALAGKPDPLGLALASFGEEAQVHWFAALDTGADQAARTDALQKAVQLYGKQAAYGAISGNASLLIIARAVNQNSELQAIALKDALVRKLMISYAFSRGFEALTRTNPDYDWPYAEEVYRSPDQAAGMSQYTLKPALLDALQSAIGQDRAIEGADRLSAALYRAGEFDRAGEFANASETSLAHWIRAKLALRAGDQKAAAASYAQAIKADKDAANNNWVPAYAEWELGNQSCRINGEAGTLALTQADITQALELFYAAGRDYYTDLAYVAERLVPTDELLSFVMSRTKPYEPQPQTPETEFDPGLERSQTREADRVLRTTTARRLMRENRYDDALALFDVAESKKAAADYAAAMQAAQKSEGVEKAKQLYAAARLARHSGIDILAFEGDPDYVSAGGNFGREFGVASSKPDLAGLKLQGISESEVKLLDSSRAKPDFRLHYRYRAVDLANQAADVVPARSQAFAAMLCEATSWVNYRDPAAGGVVYRRYLKQGPYVPWGAAFGTYECPQPNFAGAQAMVDAQLWQARKRMIKRALPFVIGGSLLLLGLGVGLWWRKRNANAVVQR